MQQDKSSKIGLRAIIIGAILIPPNCYWVMQMEAVRYSGRPTIIPLFFNVIFNIFILILVNFLLKKILPRYALRQGELLVIYAMLCIASALCGHDTLQVLIPTLGSAFQFATPENEWQDLFWQYLPRWLVMDDQRALDAYYGGSSTLYKAEHIKAWLTPSLAWCGLVTVLLFSMACINVIIRKQWTEREKLSYPIIQLPLEMMREGGMAAFFKSRSLWFGFGIAAAIDIFNGLTYIYPVLSEIPVRVQNIDYLFPEKPLSAMRPVRISLYPFAIGIGFLMPLDLSFSCWFFYILWNAGQVFGSAMGWDKLPDFPYDNEQLFGAYIGLSILALWLSRKHLRQVLRHVLGLKAEIDDSEEPIRYRVAVVGVIGAAVAISLFFYMAGMSLCITWAFFGIYLALAFAITRLRAEMGPPVHDFWCMGSTGPDTILAKSLGTKAIGARNLTMFSLLYGINRDYRGHPMPHQLEAFKMSERMGIANKGFLFFAMVLAALIGSVASFWALLEPSYRMPSPPVSRFGYFPFSRLQTWLSNPTDPDYLAIAFIGIGLVFTLLFMAARMRYFWWPLHPAGYALSPSWSMNLIWFPIFVGWSVKRILLKCGGLKSHRQAIPFFLGLILGEFLIGSIWTLIGIALNIPTYAFWI